MMTETANTGNRTGGRLGILVGGGPAPGINGVIAAATRTALERGLEVTGIMDGFKWLARGDAAHVLPLDREIAATIRVRGGSRLRTSRENPTRDPAKMRRVLETLDKLGIDRLVTIGGDDTAFSAYNVHRHGAGRIQVAHVPKTIDNDLPLPGNIPTFGYQTARHFGGQLVSNLVTDARTTSRWYLATAMGRSAGHLALGMAVAGGASLAIIPEEFAGRTVSRDDVCGLIEEKIASEAAAGRASGVVVIAEGVAELFAAELKDDPLVQVKYDEHGHWRLGEVPLSLLLKRALDRRAAKRGEERTFVDSTIGYELRCADPIAFDIEYTGQLGWGAVHHLLSDDAGRGVLISMQSGRLMPIPFGDILDTATGKTAVRRVDIESDEYRAARAALG